MVAMDHSAQDAALLAAQLADDGIAFGTENPANEALGKHLVTALADVASTAVGRTGVVVLEQTGQQAGALRDLAQDVKDMSDFETVIVRTPASTAAVSDNLTRAQVEKAQYALIAEPDYAAGVRAFGSEAENFDVPWGFVAVAAVAALAVAASVSKMAFQHSVKI